MLLLYPAIPLLFFVHVAAMHTCADWRTMCDVHAQQLTAAAVVVSLFNSCTQ